MADWGMKPEGNEDFQAPPPKSGWGTSGGTMQSNMGQNRKSNAAQYWDDRTTELVIPEIEADSTEDILAQVAEPPKMDQKMLNLKELDKDLQLNVPSLT